MFASVCEQFLYRRMAQIKSRNWTKQEDESLLAILEQVKLGEREATWNEIAQMMKLRNQSSRKTGKQCRERWANQLDPKIKRCEIWSKEENQTLFRLHIELGNRWSQICSRIPGRTDNCVKNHFYSTMRRAIRKINSYIENVKRRATLAKTFKNQILNKILALCEGKNDDKFQFNSTAKDLALQIKTNLVQLSLELSDVDEQNIEFKEKVFEQISEFSRNCRKRKSKKSCEISSESFDSEEERSTQKAQMNSIKQSKQNKNIETDNWPQKDSNSQDKQADSQAEGLQDHSRIQAALISKIDRLSKQTSSQQNLFESAKMAQGGFEAKKVNCSMDLPTQTTFKFIPMPLVGAQRLPNIYGFYTNKNLNNSERGENNGIVLGSFLSSIPDASTPNNSLGREGKKQIGFIDFTSAPHIPVFRQPLNETQAAPTFLPDMFTSKDMHSSAGFQCLSLSRYSSFTVLKAQNDRMTSSFISQASNEQQKLGFAKHNHSYEHKMMEAGFEFRDYEDKEKQDIRKVTEDLSLVAEIPQKL